MSPVQARYPALSIEVFGFADRKESIPSEFIPIGISVLAPPTFENLEGTLSLLLGDDGHRVVIVGDLG
jgi:hypothetical protein